MNLYSQIGWLSIILYFMKPVEAPNFKEWSLPSTTAISVRTIALAQPLSTMMEICDNGIDDDGDGLIDCFDSDCFSINVCDGFYYGEEPVTCNFTPPTSPVFELELIFKTDEVNYPIDQRNGAFVGDMDGDGIPEIVSKDPSPGRIQIFSGIDGTIKQSIVTANSSAFGMPAIADVDLDGNGDIFIMENNNVLARYEYGNALEVWKTGANIGDNSSASTPGIADFNADGIPEVYVGNRIFNSLNGTRLAIGSGNFGGYNSSDKHPIAYDVFQPGDPKPNGGTFGVEVAGQELLVGNEIYAVNLGNGTMDNGSLTLVSELSVGGLGDGFTSIADVDGDGGIDVVVMDAGAVYVWNPRTQTQIGSTYQLANTTGGGRLNIGDFDNDGMVEMGVAGNDIYVVLEYNPNTNMLEQKWTKTGLDDGSQRTGSTLFDFEGDGNNEVVYSEEAFLFIYNGQDGTELARIPSEAGTRTEYPLVADVNADGAAEIIVTSQNGNGPGFSGNDFISVYRSKTAPWVSARPVWNQHGYYNTNINDDLSVPRVPQGITHPSLNNAFNGFLVQSTFLGSDANPVFAAADATLQILSVNFDKCPDTLGMELKIKNIGDAVLPGGTPIAFYNNDPTISTATLIGTSTLPSSVAIDDSITFIHDLNISSLTSPFDIYSVVNDTGFMSANLPYDLVNDFPVTGTGECDFTNNLHQALGLECMEICGDGVDNDGDGLVDGPTITAPGTSGCSGETLAQMTADRPGGTWSIVSSIGSTVNNAGIVTLGTNNNPTPVTDLVIYILPPCNDTVEITTLDNQPPSLTCPNDQLAIPNNNCETIVPNYLDSITPSDNCTPTVNIVLNQTPGPGTTIGAGQTLLIITAEDISGNQSTCSLSLTVVDSISPSITCPSSQNSIATGCEVLLPNFAATLTFSDNCSAVQNITVAQSPPPGTAFAEGVHTITLLATDESGNVSSCSFTWTLTLSPPTTPTITGN